MSELQINAEGLAVAGTAHAVDVSLKFGDDVGEINLRLDGKLSLERDERASNSRT